jgi:hypothetical protein
LATDTWLRIIVAIGTPPAGAFSGGVARRAVQVTWEGERFGFFDAAGAGGFALSRSSAGEIVRNTRRHGRQMREAELNHRKVDV